MAEPLVLASVQIDESGVVSAAENINASVDSIQEGMGGATKRGKDFGDQLRNLGEHMFSLSSITRIMAHSFGLYAAAHLAITALEDTAAFRDLKTALADVWAEAVKGESAFDRLNGRLAVVSKKFGLHDVSEGAAAVADINKQIDEYTARLQKLGTHNSWGEILGIPGSSKAVQDEMSGITRQLDLLYRKRSDLQATGGLGFDPYKLFGGKSPKEVEDDLGHLVIAHAQLLRVDKDSTISADFKRKAYDKLHDSVIALGKSEAFAAGIGLGKRLDPYSTLGIPRPEDLAKGIVQVQKAQEAIHNLFHNGTIGSITFEHGVSSAVKKLRDLGVTARQMRDLGLHPMAVDLIDLAGKFDSTSAAIGFMTEGMNAAGAAIGDFVSGNKVALASVLHDTLTTIAKEASTKALFEVAAGFAASAMHDAKAAKEHWTAAAFYGEVAGVAGAGARLSGKGSASGGGGGSIRSTAPRGAGVSPSPGQHGRVVNLEVNIQGHVIGNEQWLRGAIVQMQRSLGDGTGGGAF